MKWIKQGLIYNYSGELQWAQHSFTKPTPFLKQNGILRVFGGLRDENGVSRIGYVDLDCKNLKNVLGLSKNPIIDIGKPGTFDDNGVVPTCAFNYNGKVYLYYEGYQLANKVKFLSYTGLAISEDDGDTFIKYSETPVTERINEELLIRAIHCVIPCENELRVWYTAGSKFEKIGESYHPSYNIRYLTSRDGFYFPNAGKVILDIEGDEYRVGKPFVFIKDDVYHMYYSVATKHAPYRINSAFSRDGVEFTKNTGEVICVSDSGWDSQMICYPYVINIFGELVLFYNGNYFGQTGFGYATLEY